MGSEGLSQLILEYGYWILIPLSLIEGPVVALVAGTLASLGYFNIWVLALFFFVRDMALDALYYAIGYWGGKMAWVQRMLKKVGVTEDHFDDIRRLWERKAGRTMLIGKISYGIAPAFIVAAGTVHMSLWRFFGWGAVIAIVQYWGLLALGYFFGNSFGGQLSGIVHNIEWVLAIGGLVVILYYLISWYIRRRFVNKKFSGNDSSTTEQQ